jgi:hypothetical protein
VPGLDFWAAKDGAISNVQFANYLLGSDEGQIKFGAMSNAEFVENMYASVLGRHSDTGGFNLYVGQLDAGQSRGFIMSSVIDYLMTNKTDLSAHDYLVNKSGLSSYISIAMQYEGGNDSVTSVALSHVTSNANDIEVIKVGLYTELGYA